VKRIIRNILAINIKLPLIMSVPPSWLTGFDESDGYQSMKWFFLVFFFFSNLEGS
jgi:hypothetical protein